MTENLKIAMIAINKWLFHGWNYKVVPMTVTFPGGGADTVNVPEFLKRSEMDLSYQSHAGKVATRYQNSGS